MMFLGPQAFCPSLVIPLPSNHPWGGSSVTPWASPISLLPAANHYPSTLPQGSTLYPQKEKEKQVTSRHLFHLLNKLSVRECTPSASIKAARRWTERMVAGTEAE